MSYITSYCKITNSECVVNGKKLLARRNGDDDWAKQLYKNLEVDYPKFHKMDLMCKFGLIATEILKKQVDTINAYGDDEIALIFCNSLSCFDVDEKFEQSYKYANNPSPSLFVYTLPNIVIGEIAIRNKWYGENLFLLSADFETVPFTTQCTIFMRGKSNACLCGWIDASSQKTDVFLFFAEQKAGHLKMPLTTENLNQLYKQ